jgi:dGTPase
LGRLAGKHLLEKYPHLSASLGYQANDFGAIVAAAALAHDIGNPPFGHSGEKAIGHYFKEGAGKQHESNLTKEQYEDLCSFEGNANGFKILCQSQTGSPGGLRLSYATLGAYMKYPKASLPFRPSQHVADKKFGFFQYDQAMFETVATELEIQDGKKYHRHPLAYLVEAADDICYTIIDFEDGINLGWIPESYALEYLLQLVQGTIDTKKYASLESRPQRLSYLRALAINSLIQEAARVFMENESQILEGTFPHALLDRCQYQAQIDDIIGISVAKVYQSDEVVQKEIMGYQVLTKLLDAFVGAGIHALEGRANSYDTLLLQLIPEGTPFIGKTHYETLLNVSCFVASLSDGKAKDLAQKIH